LPRRFIIAMQRTLLATRTLAGGSRSHAATRAGVGASMSRSVRELSTGASPSSGPPPPAAAAANSFLSRHPKKIAFAGALVVGGAAAYMSTSSSSSSVKSVVASSPPPFDLDHFTHFADLADFKQNQDIVLYQYETCPFCNKVRAFLDYSQIKYRVVEVNPLTKAEKRVTPQLAAIKEVPVLTINGHILTDSTPIIRNVNEIMNRYRSAQDQHHITPEEEAALDFVDKRVLILTAPNIYRTFDESLRSFDYIAQNSQLAQNTGAVKLAVTKYVGAVMMYLITEKKLKKKYNIADPRQSMYTAIQEW
jgi:microsomal prostaglandin-E synthase 2